MRYADYTYSAETQAEFFKAESNLLLFNRKFAGNPCARYMKKTLLAIDAVFATRMSHDLTLPVVPLILAFEHTDWMFKGNVRHGVKARYPMSFFNEDQIEATVEALCYMQAIEQATAIAQRKDAITLETVLQLHDILVNGKTDGNGYRSGFRSTALPAGAGSDPSQIMLEMLDVCRFMNANLFSPLGQASAIQHAIEKIAPFDTMTDRMGVVLAFMAMFKRGLFVQGYLTPICWGASTGKELREQLRCSAHGVPSSTTFEYFRERWAVYNAQNISAAVTIGNSFLDAATKLRARWRAQGLFVPTNSAIDKLLDLLLATPSVFIKHAANTIGKSYGATNEAMGQLVKAGIAKQVSLDSREQIFYCEQSSLMISKFVENLVKISEDSEATGARRWRSTQPGDYHDNPATPFPSQTGETEVRVSGS